MTSIKILLVIQNTINKKNIKNGLNKKMLNKYNNLGGKKHF